jgi:hypothetical protein
MKYTTNASGNLEVKFHSSISRDNGYTNEYLGDFDCSMELFTDKDGTPSFIEWIVEDEEQEMVEGIGLCFDGKTLQDYDGVFELPKQAIALIRKAGYIVPEEFED